MSEVVSISAHTTPVGGVVVRSVLVLAVIVRST